MRCACNRSHFPFPPLVLFRCAPLSKLRQSQPLPPAPLCHFDPRPEHICEVVEGEAAEVEHHDVHLIKGLLAEGGGYGRPGDIFDRDEEQEEKAPVATLKRKK